MNLQLDLVWNTAVMLGLVLLSAIWTYWTNFKAIYARFLVLIDQLLFIHYHIVKMLLVLVSFIDIVMTDVLLRCLNWILFPMPLVGVLDILTSCITLLLLFLIIAKGSMLIAFFLGWLNFGVVYQVSVSLWLII